MTASQDTDRIHCRLANYSKGENEMGKKRKPELLSDQLRRIIRDSGRSRNSICVAAGIDPSQLHRFYRGRHYGTLTLPGSLDRIGETLRLRLVVDDGDD